MGLPYSAARPLGSAPCVTQQCPSQGFSSERKPYSGGSSDLGTGSGMSPCLLLPSCVPWANDLVSLSLSFLTCEVRHWCRLHRALVTTRQVNTNAVLGCRHCSDQTRLCRGVRCAVIGLASGFPIRNFTSFLWVTGRVLPPSLQKADEMSQPYFLTY